jgi:glyceraldehyde-3-phosphate dehydrogenase (NADP+)
VPLGVALVLGPFNYPFNETYTNLIPALLMGNTVILKTPRTGCMCHVPTLELFQTCFPPGVVNVLHGSGRETLPVLLEEGSLDIFAFIGTSKAAVDLQRLHPHPNRLRVCLGLDAKNPAIVCADADVTVAVNECVLGSLSFNGQRCTALKVIYVHESIAEEFVKRFCAAVDNLKIGLPWHAGVNITPLPEPQKPAFLQELIKDALSKGAHIANARGGQMDKTIVAPTVLYPVTPAMRVYDEEQFGPLVPIVRFRETTEIVQSVLQSSFGQQASVFSQQPATVGPLLDVLVNQVSRVNLNAQCQRGPDSFPFTGRKNSACGTLSIADALRVFSIRSVVAFKETKASQDLVAGVMNGKLSAFLRSDYLF